MNATSKILNVMMAIGKATAGMVIAETSLCLGRGSMDECLTAYEKVLALKLMLHHLHLEKHREEKSGAAPTAHEVVHSAQNEQQRNDEQRINDEAFAALMWPDLAAGVDTVYVLPKRLLHSQN
ncbi:hypothetical protein CCAX7_55130 [Capsulimonas corticalis]|uniref:Uncharacterized protein n=1 Tax=Capsulimonas corticalis TaxID=2219043 RepID=A0A402D5V2_9BACT|nr:hypothetical protein [Capsulimonas corticalis]BDI33462.1 hypothetical protein CCAX7_55130 [Capsulimonas corticalis]